MTVFGLIIAQNLIYIFMKKPKQTISNKNHDEQKLKKYDDEHTSSKTQSHNISDIHTVTELANWGEKAIDLSNQTEITYVLDLLVRIQILWKKLRIFDRRYSYSIM